ncbi:MAG: NTP transferase domain-containing protein [Caulobacteraceae bacterium]
MQLCAVIPAAGRGSRLGLGGPKILAPITASQTVWSILYAKLSSLVDHIHVVISPEGEAAFRGALTAQQLADVSFSIQPTPLGMGDAIFRGSGVWRAAQTILVIWGDQVFVSTKTLRRAIAMHGNRPHRVVLPLVRMQAPYVEYVFDQRSHLRAVHQSREGDICATGGLADVGTFLLSADGLDIAWRDFLSQTERGSQTHELNFLPFLPYLAAHGWSVQTVEIRDTTEARGINTRDDLEFFRRLYLKPDPG